MYEEVFFQQADLNHKIPGRNCWRLDKFIVEWIARLSCSSHDSSHSNLLSSTKSRIMSPHVTPIDSSQRVTILFLSLVCCQQGAWVLNIDGDNIDKVEMSCTVNSHTTGLVLAGIGRLTFLSTVDFCIFYNSLSIILQDHTIFWHWVLYFLVKVYVCQMKEIKNSITGILYNS